MGPKKKLHLLFLLPVVFHLSTGQSIHSDRRLQDSLHCLNDYNNNITCVWNSTSISDQRTVAADTKCTLISSMVLYGTTYNSIPCDLRPFDESKPAMRRCSLVYSFTNYVFTSTQTCSINITCEPLNNNLISIIYKPVDHIKLNPPQRPSIINSTISWEVLKNIRIDQYSFHIQWKQKAQSWKNALEKRRPHCGLHCNMELDPEEDLELDETYQVRVRVLANDSWAKSTWSDWSPTATWRSLIGRQSSATEGPSALGWDTVLGVILGVVVVLSLAAFILCKTQRINWVYVVKKFEGPPLPNPAEFFLHDGNLQAWPNPQFTNESFESLMKKVDIFSPIEVTSNVDKCALCGPEKKQCGSGCTSSHSWFSNPNYCHLYPPPISSLTEGNLEPCAVDSPYEPSGRQNGREEERGKHMDILGSIEVCSDYERVEMLQDQLCSLQSPDSGMGSGVEEQTSQATGEV